MTLTPRSSYYGYDDKIEYEYDANGNITDAIYYVMSPDMLGNLQYAESSRTHYEYDSRNRIKRENNEQLGQTIIYSYNSYDNLDTKYVYRYSTDPDVSNLILDKSYDFVYNPRRRDQLYSVRVYDANDTTCYNGCMGVRDEDFSHYLSGGPAIYRDKWAFFNNNRLNCIDSTDDFAYDASGRRIRKNDTHYTYRDGKLHFSTMPCPHKFYII